MFSLLVTKGKIDFTFSHFGVTKGKSYELTTKYHRDSVSATLIREFFKRFGPVGSHIASHEIIAVPLHLHQLDITGPAQTLYKGQLLKGDHVITLVGTHPDPFFVTGVFDPVQYGHHRVGGCRISGLIYGDILKS